jgi:dUTP pyrophosphatase
MNNQVKIINASSHQQLVKGSEHAVGYDLRANLYGETLQLDPGDTLLVDTGVYVELPNDMEMQIRSRSGNALRGLLVVNSPGTIDPDYRGEIKVIVKNIGSSVFYIKDGQKIAQAVFAKFESPNIITAGDLTATERGEGGFGSTGE